MMTTVKQRAILSLVSCTIWTFLMLSALFFVFVGLNWVTIPVQAPIAPTASLLCVPREALLTRIKKDAATPLFVGLSTVGLGLEVWHNPDDLWIAFFSRPDGLACIVSQGIHMGFVDPADKDQAPALKTE